MLLLIHIALLQRKRLLQIQEPPFMLSPQLIFSNAENTDMLERVSERNGKEDA